jgi:hypothetical protein
MVGVQWTRPRADAPVLLPLGAVGCLANGPAHEQEQCDNRDLQQDHQPDERPGGHSPRSYTRRRIGTTPDGPSAKRDRPGCQALGPQGERRFAELGHRLQLVDARDDLGARQALDALGPELLHVE